MSKEVPVIAVVDDEESVRKALDRLLSLARLKVETFASGAEFLGSLTNHTPDCVVLDLHMPGLDGFETESELARRGFRVPVVVLTGREMPRDRERAMESGSTAFLLKPVDAQALVAAITAAIKMDTSHGTP